MRNASDNPYGGLNFQLSELVDGGQPPTFACHECRYHFPTSVTMGVVAAHFETEHPAAEMAVELVEPGGSDAT